LNKTLEKDKELSERDVFILLDEISSKLSDITEIKQEILAHLKETTPEGFDLLVFEGTVSPPEKVINVEIEYPHHRLFQMQVINKGPDTVYAHVNLDDEIPIEADEDVTFKKEKAEIRYITIRLEAGKTATVKILGRY
jgi:hypothetical protein